MDVEPLFFANRNEWREWLQCNFNSNEEFWVKFFKKNIKENCMSYNEAVEEAICFGWIDSRIQNIDEQSYKYRFTKRRKPANWSNTNKKRAKQMISQGKMTDADRVFLEGVDLDKEDAKSLFEIPDLLKEEFIKNAVALRHFEALTPSHQQQYLGWIYSAKKLETRKRRISEAIALLENNKSLGMK